MTDATTRPHRPLEPAPSPPINYRRFVLVAVLAALAIATTGILVRAKTTVGQRTTAAEASLPTVAVVTPEVTNATGTLVLPGTLEPLNGAAIYAQTSGYLREWFVDIGDPVRKGQQLAVLDAPELEHQLAQARADYNTALAEQRLARSLAKRAEDLLKNNAIAAQEAEERTGDYDAKAARSEAALANVRKFEALQGFTLLTAPFDGVVTSRSAQTGDLIIAGVASARPLFTIADARRVRVYVRAPQSHAALIQAGQQATLALPEYPGRQFPASVTRSARAVDAQSGSVLVELQAANDDGVLLPGAYAQVTFELPTSGQRIRVPGSALLYRDDRPSIAVVDANNQVTLNPVTIGRDEGRFVEITTGISTTDRVIATPPDAIRTGDRVRVSGQ